MLQRITKDREVTMKNIAPFEQISSIEKVVKKYFPGNDKLYCLTENEIYLCGATYDIDIMYIFNDRSWLDVWNNFDAIKIGYMVGMSSYALTIPVKYYRRINKLPEISNKENYNNVRYFLTGLLYMCTVADFNDKSFPPQASYSILDHWDPKEPYETYDGYIDPIKDFFPSLIEKYTSEQLFLLSILFMELPKHADISELGKKYWTWIYENTDDDIRKKIIKEFEESS